MQPAVDQRLGGRLGVAPVLPEDVGPRMRISPSSCDPHLDAGQRPADRAELEVVERPTVPTPVVSVMPQPSSTGTPEA